MMQNEMAVTDFRTFIQMIDAISIEQGSTPLEAMHFITFVEQEFSQVGSVLPGNAGYKSLLHHRNSTHADSTVNLLIKGSLVFSNCMFQPEKCLAIAASNADGVDTICACAETSCTPTP
jgi:hypothetical protein